MDNDNFIIQKVMKNFNKKYTNKGLFNKIKQHRCKTCNFAYIQGNMFACEYCEKWCGFKTIRPTRLLCFSYKRRENNAK